MRKRLLALSCFSLVAWGAVLCSAQPSARPPSQQSRQADHKKREEKDRTTTLKVVVTGGDNNEPVENASVYIRYRETRFLRKDRQIELNLKTNREGVVQMPDLPRGTVLIQVVAEGWNTFGHYYTLDQDRQTIQIHLEKPKTRWY
jgi:hypothetical protein